MERKREYIKRVVTDLAELRRLGAEKDAENVAFRRHLAAHHHRIEEFQVIAEEVNRHIDCTQCANCCRHSVVTVTRREIEAIASYLGLPAEDVTRQFTVPEADAPALRELASTRDGCVFLEGNLCGIYPARPKACHDFPHVGEGDHSLGARLESLCRWASLCPIVYNALEEYKRVVGYR